MRRGRRITTLYGRVAFQFKSVLNFSGIISYVSFFYNDFMSCKSVSFSSFQGPNPYSVLFFLCCSSLPRTQLWQNKSQLDDLQSREGVLQRNTRWLYQNRNVLTPQHIAYVTYTQAQWSGWVLWAEESSGDHPTHSTSREESLHTRSCRPAGIVNSQRVQHHQIG